MDVNCSIHVQIMYSMLCLWLFSVSFYRFVGLRLVHLFKLLFYSCYFMVNLSLMSDHDGTFCFSVHKFNHIVYPVPPSYIFFLSGENCNFTSIVVCIKINWKQWKNVLKYMPRMNIHVCSRFSTLDTKGASSIRPTGYAFITNASS